MPYLSKTIAPNVELGITNGSVIVPVRFVNLLNDTELANAIRGLAADHEILQDFLSGGMSASANTVEDALNIVAIKKQKTRSLEVKRELTKDRRKEFAARRTDLFLALINRDDYICQVDGCDIQDKLSIDHIVPLSRGGTDDLSNLRFLCLSHNSQKGDRF